VARDVNDKKPPLLMPKEPKMARNHPISNTNSTSNMERNTKAKGYFGTSQRQVPMLKKAE
jgi:hypothetical protein